MMDLILYNKRKNNLVVKRYNDDNENLKKYNRNDKNRRICAINECEESNEEEEEIDDEVFEYIKQMLKRHEKRISKMEKTIQNILCDHEIWKEKINKKQYHTHTLDICSIFFKCSLIAIFIILFVLSLFYIIVQSWLSKT